MGPVAIDPNAQLGAVYEVDTASLAVTRKVTVGYQPDELEVLGEYLYVANSGGYRAPDYDSTVSVVEIYGMKQIQKIPVGINLHRIRSLKSRTGGRIEASLENGERLVVSRHYAPLLRERLGL